MRFALPALSAAQIPIATKPEMGVESDIFISAAEVILVGKVSVDAAGAVTWAPEPGVDLGDGMDLHAKVNFMATATAAPTLTITGTLDDDNAGTADADLAVPSWWRDQSKTFQEGFGEDFIPNGAGNSAKLIKAIASVAVTNVPANAEFLIYGSPPAASFIEYGWKRGAQGAYNVPATVSFADGYNPNAAVKPGRGETRELTLSFAHVAAGFAIGRFNGKRVAVLLKVRKNRKTVHTENIVYVGYIPSSTPNRGDGNDEVVEESKGMFEDCLQFTAK